MDQQPQQEQTYDSTESKTERTDDGAQIVYQFSGANMAGQTLLVCGQCGSLIKEDSTGRHTAWHQAGAV